MFQRFCTESAAEEFSRFELEREMKMQNTKDSCALVGDTFEFVDENLNGIFF